MNVLISFGLCSFLIEDSCRHFCRCKLYIVSKCEGGKLCRINGMMLGQITLDLIVGRNDVRLQGLFCDNWDEWVNLFCM